MSQYDPKKVILTYAGQQVNLGTAAGTFITAERNSDLVQMYVGSDGEYLAAVNRDKSSVVTLTLMGSSQANDILQAQLALTESGGQGGAPLQLADLNGRTVLFAAEAWVMRPPSVGYGQEGADMDREWALVCGALEFKVGGNIL
jgi:hypothetical protein